MTSDEVRALVEQGIDGAEVHVQGDGDRFSIIAISDAFEGRRLVQQHQLVNACLNDCIAAGDIHAVDIKTYTREAWETARRRGLI